MPLSRFSICCLITVVAASALAACQSPSAPGPLPRIIPAASPSASAGHATGLASNANTAPDAAVPDSAAAELPLWSEPEDWVDRTHLPSGMRVFTQLYDDPRVRTCGPIQVRQRVDHVRSEFLLDLLSADGTVLKALKPTQGLGGWVPEWCFDVTGDGNPELLVDEGSGGAHCCHTYHLYELVPRLREILVHPAGNGAFGLWPRDLDGAGAFELMGKNDALAVLGSSAYAFAPFLPEVFGWDGSKYTRRTRQFPEFLRGQRAQAVERAAKDCDATDAGCWEPAGEEILGLSLLIGDWPSWSKTSPIPRAALKALEKLRPKLARAL